MSLFDEHAAPAVFTREQKIASIEREISMRKRVYPGWVAARRMSQPEGKHRDRRDGGDPSRLSTTADRKDRLMKNKLTDLNDHLFAQLERLADESLTPEEIETEAKRGEAIVAVADKIIDNARLGIAAVKIVADYGDRFAPSLPMINVTPASAGAETPRRLTKAAGT